MKKYLFYTLTKIKEIKYYKFNFYSKLISSTIMFVTQYYLWKAIYNQNYSLNNIKFNDMVLYLCFSSLLTRFIGSGLERNIGERYRGGSITIDILRPINIIIKDFFYDLGRAIVELLSSLLIIFPILLLNIDFINIDKILIFIILLFNSYILYFLISYSLGFICFWTKSTIGISALKVSLWGILSGTIMPFQFYPEWLKIIVSKLPFKLACYDSISILIFNYDFTYTLNILGLQLIWILIFILTIMILNKLALNAFVSQGG